MTSNDFPFDRFTDHMPDDVLKLENKYSLFNINFYFVEN